MNIDTNSSPTQRPNTSDLAGRLRSLENTERPTNGSQDRTFDPDSPRRPLTEREKQILRLVCDGLTNAGIATRLGIAAETVKSELKRIFRKIEVKNRTQAAVLLVKQGIL